MLGETPSTARGTRALPGNPIPCQPAGPEPPSLRRPTNGYDIIYSALVELRHSARAASEAFVIRPSTFDASLAFELKNLSMAAEPDAGACPLLVPIASQESPSLVLALAVNGKAVPPLLLTLSVWVCAVDAKAATNTIPAGSSTNLGDVPAPFTLKCTVTSTGELLAPGELMTSTAP